MSSGEGTEFQWLCKGSKKKFETKMNHGGRGRRPGQDDECAEANRDMAPTKRDSV